MSLKIKNLKSYSLLLVFAIFLFLLSFPVNAEETSGKNPLFIKGYRMVDALNEEGIRLTELELFFSKNVVNMMVSENNKKCFSLFNDAKELVPVEIRMADDQIEREKRHIVKVIAQNPLEPGKSYQLIISPDLEAKNGIKLEKQVKINFVTLDIIK